MEHVLYVGSLNGRQVAITDRWVREHGYTERLAAIYTEGYETHRVTLRAATAAIDEQANNEAGLQPHPNGGWGPNPVKLVRARARLMVDSWTFAAPPGDVSGLALDVANVIHGLIEEAMYPKLSPDFRLALERAASPGPTGTDAAETP